MSRTVSRLVASVALASMALASGCAQQRTLPSDCSAPMVERAATLTDGGLAPDGFDVCKGQAVTLSVTVQASGTLHLQGFEDQVAPQDVSPGEVAKLSFTASQAGQFFLELHKGADEIDLAIVTVHAP